MTILYELASVGTACQNTTRMPAYYNSAHPSAATFYQIHQRHLEPDTKFVISGVGELIYGIKTIRITTIDGQELDVLATDWRLYEFDIHRI